MAKFKLGEKVRYKDKIVEISAIEEYHLNKLFSIYNFSENIDHNLYTENCFSKLISCPEYIKNETQI